MGAPKKVNVGSEFTEFPGRSFNLLVEEWFRTKAQLGRSGGGSSGPGQILTVKAKNVTGAALNYGHCVAIESLAIDYDDKDNQQYGRPLIKANKHTSALKHAILAVALKPIANNQAGPFAYAGPVWLQCDVTDGDHNFADVEHEQSTFSPLAKSGASGHPILARESTGTGTKWVLALLGGAGDGGSDSRYGMVVLTVPGATLVGDPDFTCDFGSTPESVVLLKVNDAEDGLEPELDEEEEPIVLTGMWSGKTDFRASDDEPIIVTGERRGDIFIINPNTDLRMLPGLVAADDQIPYKLAGDVTFQLGGAACEGA